MVQNTDFSKMSPEEVNKEIKKITAYAKLTAGTVAGVTGGDVKVAAQAAEHSVENNAAKLIITAAKVVYKVAKKGLKNGKIEIRDFKKTLKDEGYDLADNLITLADGSLNWDDARAIIDIVVGTELNKANKGEAARKIKEVLDRNKTAGNSPNVRHTSSFRQHVSIERKQNIASLFGNRSQGLKLNNTELKEIPNSANKVNTTRVLDSSRISDTQLKQDVFAYAKQLGSGKELTAGRKEGVWYMKTPDGATINVRSVSSTELPDGSKPRWTIEIVNDKRLQSMINDKTSIRNQPREIKFK